MKIRTRIPAKVVAKPPQQPIQTTLERHSISNSLPKKSEIKTQPKISNSQQYINIKNDYSFNHIISKLPIQSQYELATNSYVQNKVSSHKNSCGCPVCRKPTQISLKIRPKLLKHHNLSLTPNKTIIFPASTINKKIAAKNSNSSTTQSSSSNPQLIAQKTPPTIQRGLFSKIKKGFKKIGRGLKSTASRTWRGIKKFGNSAWKAIKKAGKFVGNGLKWIGKQLWSKLRSFFNIGIGTVADPNEIPDLHILLEYVAHHVVYEPEKFHESNKQMEILTKAGYDVKNIVWETGPYGFQACLIKPLPKARKTVTPILAIRGTDSLGGMSTDLDFAQVGNKQFSANRKLISKMLNLAGRSVNLTGHSLGGTVSQIITANFPGKVENLVTFQCPGIDLATLAKFKSLPKSRRPKTITHHIAKGDIADLAGDAYLPGNVYEHYGLNPDWEQKARPHTGFVFNNATFRQRREDLGLTDEFMKEQVGKETRTGKTPIIRYERYPYEFRRILAERTRRGISAGTAVFTIPFDVLHSSKYSDERPDKHPDSSRRPIASPPAMKKISEIFDYLEGWTSEYDIHKILTILASVKSRSEMLEIRRAIEPNLSRYLININDINRIRLAFQQLL